MPAASDKFSAYNVGVSGPARNAFKIAVATTASSGLATATHAVTRAFWVPTAGNVRVITAEGQDVTIAGIAAGTLFPLQIKRVHSTTVTSSDGIIALW